MEQPDDPDVEDRELFDLDDINELEPFEIDVQLLHLMKHHPLGVAEVKEVWEDSPLFYPAKPPAHGQMVGWVEGQVLQVPLAPSDVGDPTKCRPIGCYPASKRMQDQYRLDSKPKAES